MTIRDAGPAPVGSASAADGASADRRRFRLRRRGRDPGGSQDDARLRRARDECADRRHRAELARRAGLVGDAREAVRAQFRSVVDDIGVDAIKTGMLGRRARARWSPTCSPPCPSAPRWCSTRSAWSKHGDPLIDDDAVAALRTLLFPLRHRGHPEPGTRRGLLAAAGLRGRVRRRWRRPCSASAPRWVLVKGGHAAGDPTDVLSRTGVPVQDLRGARGKSTPTPTARAARWPRRIACRLALGDDVPGRRLGRPRGYVIGAIAGGFPLGAGIGPTDHLWGPASHLGRRPASLSEARAGRVKPEQGSDAGGGWRRHRAWRPACLPHRGREPAGTSTGAGRRRGRPEARPTVARRPAPRGVGRVRARVAGAGARPEDTLPGTGSRRGSRTWLVRAPRRSSKAREAAASLLVRIGRGLLGVWSASPTSGRLGAPARRQRRP